jgi:NAD+ synthase
MIKGLRIAVAQINPVVGDLTGNRAMIEAVWREREDQADLILFPEMVLTGYPLEDLVFRTSFIEDVRTVILELVALSRQHKCAILIGAPWRLQGMLYNAAFLIEGGNYKIILKRDLPNYGVFDEVRIFARGPLPDVTEFRGHKLGIMICWDFWTPDVAAHLKEQGAEILIIPNGSTYENTKHPRRLAEGKKRATETGLPLLYVNLVGGQDELVFDGASFAMDESGAVIFQMKAFTEDVRVVNSGDIVPYPEDNNALYSACVRGLRDYVHKCGFSDVLLGLSGGIDSALVAVMAVDALGADRVHCLMLPSPFTSRESYEDAAAIAKNLGVSYQIISIEPAMQAFSRMMTDLSDLAHENMQARARGVTLMSLSNQSGAILLSTGNKSELAVGYSTLYGDMCGAFNPLKDLYKTKVFELSRLRNNWKPDFGWGTNGVVIPERVLTRPPSAELRADQTDQDSLPPYHVLDQVLALMIEGEKGVDEVITTGFDAVLVKRVYKMLHGAEYKRRQSCPGVNLTTKSFGGRSRRYPVVNKY